MTRLHRSPPSPVRRQRTHRAAALILAVGMWTALSSCGGSGGDSQATVSPAPEEPVTGNPDSTALTTVTVVVPEPLRSAPFDRPKTLTVPEGTSVSLFARVPNARFMAVAPNGDLLVSNPENGTVTLLRPRGEAIPERFTFAAGLTNPHDMVFHVIGETTYLYIAESNRIVRSVYTAGAVQSGTFETVVANLPDASTPELGGNYGHQLKNIAIRNDRLYVSIASTCNACLEDTQSNPLRGAIYEYDLDGGNRRLYAQGLRNAEGLAFRPGTTDLWVTVNNRDNVAYPFRDDWDGDGRDDYGRVMQSYVDGHPPDVLTLVQEGGHYGWPFCNPTPDQGSDNPPYDRDVEWNPDGARLDCNAIPRATKALPPHSAPLGMSFLANAGLPPALQNSVAVALHGCWNCTRLNGHEIVVYPLRPDGSLGESIALASGWVTDPVERERWGRPVDVIPDGRGGLYVSDDFADAVYRISF